MVRQKSMVICARVKDVARGVMREARSRGDGA